MSPNPVSQQQVIRACRIVTVHLLIKITLLWDTNSTFLRKCLSPLFTIFMNPSFVLSRYLLGIKDKDAKEPENTSNWILQILSMVSVKSDRRAHKQLRQHIGNNKCLNISPFFPKHYTSLSPNTVKYLNGMVRENRIVSPLFF